MTWRGASAEPSDSLREAIRAIDADPAVFREAVERVEKANRSGLEIPKEKPDATLREIERLLAHALECLKEGRLP